MSVERRNFSKSRFTLELPNLLAVQTSSFDQFLQKDVPASQRRKVGLEQVFRDIFPICDQKERYELEFDGYSVGEPRYTFQECQQKGLSYAAPLKAKINLKVYDGELHYEGEEGEHKLLEVRTGEVSFGDMPLMTENGSFLISGAERVVVSQLHRSPGVSFDEEQSQQGNCHRSRIIPQRGSWVEFFTEPSGILYVSVDRHKKLPATILFRAMGLARNEDILALYYTAKTLKVDAERSEELVDQVLFSDVFDEKTGERVASANSTIDEALVNKLLDAGVTEIKVVAESVKDDPVISATIAADPCREVANPREYALAILYQVQRSRGDEHAANLNKIDVNATDLHTARANFDRSFFDEKAYDLGEVGRYRLTSRTHLDFVVDLLMQAVAEETKRSDSKFDVKALEAAVKAAEKLDPKKDAAALKEARKEIDALWKPFFARLEGFVRRNDADSADRMTIEPRQDEIDAFFRGPFVSLLKKRLEKEGARAQDEIFAGMIPSGVFRGLLATLPMEPELVKGVGEGLFAGRTPAIRRTLTNVDFMLIAGYMVALANTFEEMFGKFDTDARIRLGVNSFADLIGSRPVVLDDIDHLGNRRIRSVGELLASEVSKGLAKMARTIRDRLSHPGEDEALVPADLINSRAVSSAVQSFFGSSQLSQFMDQTNPLAELTHKRRVSALGPGGITRDRAGFEVRDVHYTHYGRLCPIETPEGPNIGLINSLATYARVNPFGFIETPYRKVRDGKVSDEIVYLTADQEDNYKIASAAAALDAKGNILDDYVPVRMKGDFPVLSKNQVELMDVAPKQIVSVAAGLIPFLEHDDANRALMGSNMQRPAVPLLRAEAPVVGTGLEAAVARDSGTMVIAKHAGEVIAADARCVKVRRSEALPEDKVHLPDADVDVYELTKFQRSNQDTCVTQHLLARVGDKVEAGTVLADGASTDGGELSLGKNIRIAFLPWNGYNYEDAIIISEELRKKDAFTSIHIEEFEIEVRETKRGPEELTREIPNVGEDALKDLDENGIVRVGAEVVAGDILVGRITPKGETELSPEERLLRAIFSEKASDVRDTSLRAPAGMKGIVVETRVFVHKTKDKASKQKDEELEAKIREEANEKVRYLEAQRDEKLRAILSGETCVGVKSAVTGRDVLGKGKKFTDANVEILGRESADLEEGARLCSDEAKNARAWSVISSAKALIEKTNDATIREIDKIQRGDELKPGVLKSVKVYIAQRRALSVGDKMSGRHGNKGVVSKIVPVEDMPFTEDGEPIQILLNPLGVPSRMNVGQVLEVHLGWAAKTLGLKFATPVFDGATYDDVIAALGEAKLPKSGKTHLIDGRTGERFHSPVVVGYMYMLKLHHLVDDKMHARAIGPYSLVTQQPLGGKSQSGGQRFGEMEVWALQAYGAAYTLQEILTVKSDDTVGRTNVYNAIVHGENAPEPGIPESFNVLIREIRALGLDIKIGE